jgi:hypothetical protein
VWEIVHKSCGYGAVILAIPTIFTGLKAIDPPASMAVQGLYAAWVAITLLTFIISFLFIFLKGRYGCACSPVSRAACGRLFCRVVAVCAVYDVCVCAVWGVNVVVWPCVSTPDPALRVCRRGGYVKALSKQSSAADLEMAPAGSGAAPPTFAAENPVFSKKVKK